MSEANLGEHVSRRRYSLPELFRARYSDTQRYLIIWIITGVACGLAAVAFHHSIQFVFDAVVHFGRYIGGGNPLILGAVLILSPTLGGLISGLILTYLAPHGAGSGIPQTKVRYYRDFGIFRLSEVAWRFILGTISVGSGMALGREGPTVHLCSALASNIGQFFGLAKKRVQAMVPLGMGAGIAAAFNAPMAALFFVFEELLGDFSGKSYFGIIVAVVIASAVQRLIAGEHPAFDLQLGELSTAYWMILAAPLGVMAAFLGKAFVEAILRTRQRVSESKQVPKWLRPAIGGLMVGVIGVSIMFLTEGHLGIFGIGYNDVDAMLNGRLNILFVAVLLLIGKFVASSVAYGFGGSGGLFAPTLFIGAMLGGIVGILGQYVIGYDNEIVGAMAMLGMGAFFAAVVRCPMTSIVIIWEMTRQDSLILPLMLGNIIAWLISSRLQPVPLYDSLLLQDKISLRKLPDYQGDQDWRNLPVSTIMTFEPATVQGSQTVQECLDALKKSGTKHHGYPVVDIDGRLIGMITHHEMCERVATDGQELLTTIMAKREIISVRPETSIRDVAQILVVEDVMQAPVVSATDPQKILGIVTLHDIARQQNQIDQSLGR
ncbi:MAG: chloride channel protein [Verrucomicrobiota bacterium JB022]|nr:chloride channel protein [Verrucomicrobiota bacterium JB022]